MKQIITILALITTFEAMAQRVPFSSRAGRRTETSSSHHPHARRTSAENQAMIARAANGTAQAQERAEAECLMMFNALTNDKGAMEALDSRPEKVPPTSRYSTIIYNMNEMVNKGLVIEQSIIINTCKSETVKLYSETDEEMSRNLSDIRLGAAGRRAGAAALEGTLLPKHVEFINSPENISACIEKSMDECRTEAPASAPFSLAVELVNATASGIPRFSSEDCTCASQKFMSERGNRTSREMDTAKNELEKDLNEFVIKAFGKKFINDYASNLENLDYFLNERKEVFSAEGAERDDAGIQYQCNKEASYRQKIQTACANSKLSAQEQEARIQKLLSAWGKPAFTSFDEHMKQIGDDVLIRKPSSARTMSGPSSDSPFIRRDYDAFRTTQIADDKSIIFADRAAASIIKNSSSSTRWRELLLNNSPEEAFVKLLAEESTKSPSVFTELLSQADLEQSVFGREMKSLIGSRDTTLIETKVRAAFASASMNHPGFKMVMNDKDKLSEFSISPDSISLIAQLESERAGGFLDRKFHESCDNLQKKFAEAVCTDEDKLLSQIDPQELAVLLSENESTLNSDVNVFNKLLCEKGGRTTPLFENLDIDHLPAHSRSDYLGKLMAESKSPAEESMDDFSVIMRLMRENQNGSGTGGGSSGGVAGNQSGSGLSHYANRRITDRLSGGETPYSRPRSSQNSSSRLASQFTPPDSRSNSNSTVPTSSQTIAANSRAQNSVMRDEAQSDNTVQSNAFASNFVNSVPASVSGPVIPNSYTSPDNSKRDARSELRDALSNDTNRNEVDKLVSNIDDSTARELSKLREESLSNQKKVLELSSEAEKNKLKDLEKRIRDLQSARKVAARNSSNDEEEESNSNISRRKNSNIDGREIASIDGSLDKLPAAQNFSTAGVSGGSPSGSNTAAAVRAGVSNDARDASSAIKPAYSNNGALIISSNALVPQGQELKPSEMNKELLKYLTQSEPDISTLMNIKTSGMVYKFKVFENGQYIEKEVMLNYDALNQDIKSLIDLKIASKKGLNRSVASIDEELGQVKRTHSYLSLKFIIDQQVKR